MLNNSPTLEKQNKKNPINIIIFPNIRPSLLAMLLLEIIAFVTGHRKAGDEGKELFKAQLVVFVGVQIFHDAFHSFGVILGLKKAREGSGFSA